MRGVICMKERTKAGTRAAIINQTTARYFDLWKSKEEPLLCCLLIHSHGIFWGISLFLILLTGPEDLVVNVVLKIFLPL